MIFGAIRRNYNEKRITFFFIGFLCCAAIKIFKLNGLPQYMALKSSSAAIKLNSIQYLKSRLRQE